MTSSTTNFTENSDVGEKIKEPLWKFVTVTDEAQKGGGNCKFKCNFCGDSFGGSYFRVRCHLLKFSGKGIKVCRAISEDKRRELEILVKESIKLKKNNQARLVPLPSSKESSSSRGRVTGLDLLDELLDDPSKKRKGINGPLDKMFNDSAKEILDSEIARMFYTGGLSFNLAKNPHYIRAFNRACASSIAGYRPPGYNSLRNALLIKERTHIEKLLAPIKYTWEQKGVSVCSDGWSDTQRRPLINVMAASESGPMFLKAVNCEGETKDMHFISDLLIASIREIGPQHVVQVITDNASNCKAAGAIVNATFPHIFWTPCVVHTLNLALKNICAPSSLQSNFRAYEACKWISDTSDDVWFIKNFIMNHSMRLAMFNDHSHLRLLSVADTRFASVVVMLKRFKEIKSGLESMVMSSGWEDYRGDDILKARSVKEMIVNDDFWEKINYILDFTSPIYGMLRRCDTDEPCLHLVYEWWDVMIEEVKSAIFKKECKEYGQSSVFFEVVYAILLSRWTKSSSPLHCLAHSLNPRYYTEKYLNGIPNRIPPHQDAEISRERKICIKKYFSDDEQRLQINEEFSSFSSCLNEFADSDSIKERGTMRPMTWWNIHGACAPNLQILAKKLLGQPCSSSCCERNWSTYKFIHSLKRNRITPQRAEDLVFVHNNLRLLSRKDDKFSKGGMWDIGGDEFDSMNNLKGGMLEVASLSLDEPDLEKVLFEVDGED